MRRGENQATQTDGEGGWRVTPPPWAAAVVAALTEDGWTWGPVEYDGRLMTQTAMRADPVAVFIWRGEESSPQMRCAQMGGAVACTWIPTADPAAAARRLVRKALDCEGDDGRWCGLTRKERAVLAACDSDEALANVGAGYCPDGDDAPPPPTGDCEGGPSVLVVRTPREVARMDAWRICAGTQVFAMSNARGELVIEGLNGTRRLTIFASDARVSIVRSWGLSLYTEMADVDAASVEAVEDAWAWLEGDAMAAPYGSGDCDGETA